MGKETVLELAKHHPKLVAFTGRDAARAQEVISLAQSTSSTTLCFIPCDLASLSSVQAAVRTFLAQSTHRLDVLMCNAGIMCVNPDVTKDGYEVQLGINHMSHALLIQLLLPTLKETVGSRIVSLSSSAMAFPPNGGIAFDTLKTPQNSGLTPKMTNYAQSKLANILYPQELARRNPEITAISIHPGIVATELMGNLGWMDWALVKLFNPKRLLPVKEGAYNQLWAATTPAERLVNGRYYEPVGKVGQETKETKNKDLAKKLYDWTERELKPYLIVS